MVIIRETRFGATLLNVDVSRMKNKQYDVMIVGGGMVGLVLALALAKYTPLSIVILEAKEAIEEWNAIEYHHRVSAISLASKRILSALNVWDALIAKRVSRFEQVEVWEASTNAHIHFDCKDISENALGYVIENNLIQSVLREKIANYPQIEFISPIELISFKEHHDYLELGDINGLFYKAKLAVAADGVQSWLRREAGIAVHHQTQYQELAMVATVETEFEHGRIARQVFNQYGPLAFLPLSKPTLSSIVWSLPKGIAQEKFSLNTTSFQHELAHYFSERLGKIISSSKRYLFPLMQQEAKHYVKSRIVLVGDAAHSVHPLAGQGINMGLLDAASLAEIIMNALNNNDDFFDPIYLRRYERWRRADNKLMMKAISLIHHLFSKQNTFMSHLRSIGLKKTNELNLLKNVFSRHAAGIKEHLPFMAR